MKKIIILLFLTIFILGCTQQVEEPSNNEVDVSGGQTQLANPSAVYCVEQGYVYDVRQTDAGSTGYCVFEDGTECPGWEYFRGECSE